MADEDLGELLEKMERTHEEYQKVATNAAPYLVDSAYRKVIEDHNLPIDKPIFDKQHKDDFIKYIIEELKEKGLPILKLVKGEKYVDALSDEAWETVLGQYFGVNTQVLNNMLRNYVGKEIGQDVKQFIANTIGRQVGQAFSRVLDGKIQHHHIDDGKKYVHKKVSEYGGPADSVVDSIRSREDLVSAIENAYSTAYRNKQDPQRGPYGI